MRSRARIELAALVLVLAGTGAPCLAADVYADRPVLALPDSAEAVIVSPDAERFDFPDELPRPIRDIEPPYPDALEGSGIEGSVFVRVLVSASGEAVETVVLEGPDALRPYAGTAVAEAAFVPARANGIPVACWLHLTVMFTHEGRRFGVTRGEIGFDQNDRALTWRAVNNGRYTLSDRATLRFDSNLNTTLNIGSGSMGDRWYDTVYNRAAIGYDLTERLDLEIAAREDWNRDSFSRFNKPLVTTSLDGTLSYAPARGIDIHAGLGGMLDRRFENEDSGITFTGGLNLVQRPARSVNATLSLDGAASTLDRANDTFQVRGNVAWDLPGAHVTLGLDENRQRRGYLSDVDRRGIEHRDRIERTASLSVIRGVPGSVTGGTGMLLSMTMGRRILDDSANDDDASVKYHNNAEGTVRDMALLLSRRVGSSAYAEIEGGYTLDDNVVDNPLRSRLQTDVSLRGRAGVGIGSADSLSAVGWIKRTRIDTPEGVPNDRDELKYETGIKYMHIFSDYFNTGLDFRVLETHYVNIDASQSTQNKWIKTFLFSPSLEYRPIRPVRISHLVTLYANHMNYDFDSESNPRSTITRRVSAETWVRAEISARTRLIAGVMVEENDYGNLDHLNRMLPLEQGTRWFGDVAVELDLADWATVVPHYRYAVRSDENTGNDVLIRRDVDQTFGMDIRLWENSLGEYAVLLSLWREVRMSRNARDERRNYADLTMRYAF